MPHHPALGLVEQLPHLDAEDVSQFGELAVASDGTVFVNVTHYRGVRAVEELVALAIEEKREVFIGVALEPAEVEDVLEWLSHGGSEVVAYVIGRRMWRV